MALLQRQVLKISDSVSSTSIVRVLQWNILAQGLTKDSFSRCPNGALQFNERMPKIIKEITRFDADVICLEEADVFPHIDKELVILGYKGFFFPKVSSPCLKYDLSSPPDGCAMFYKTKSINLISSNNINIQSEGKITNQVAIFSKFSLKSHPEKEFFVAVTHLKAKHSMHNLRLNQAQFLLELLNDTIGLSKPIIFCGDFNAHPGEPAYKAVVAHKLGFSSTYTKLNGDNTEPEYTTFKFRNEKDEDELIAHTVDFIFYTRQHLTPISVLSIPTQEEIGENGIPSMQYPSDHFSLMADFLL